MKKYKAIIYDLDGTVLNTINMNMYPLIKIIKEETGEDWTFEQVLKFLPYPGMKVMEELQVADKEKAYPGFEEIFEAFDGSIIQAVASAKTTAQYQIDFVAKGLDKYMKTAVLANDTVKHKPDPEPLLECLKRLSLQPEDVIYIGDAHSDYLASKNAGIDFGYAKWGSVSAKGIDKPDHVFEQPLDLLKLLS